MECSHARLLLLFSSPGPAEIAEESEALHAHLDQCRDCRNLAHRDRLTDAALGPAMRKVPVPGDLQERILQRLQRGRRSNPWPWVAGAAGLLVAVSLATYWYLQPAATMFDHVAFEMKSQSSSSDWFDKEGVAFAMPPNMDPYLESWDVVLLQGRRVAKLTFVKPGEAGQENAIVHVYVIPRGMFHFDPEFVRNAAQKSGRIELRTGEDFDFLFSFSRGSRGAFKQEIRPL